MIDMAGRVLRAGEELIHEGPTSYVGGLDGYEKDIPGTLVLTSLRLSFEYNVGSLFSKRSENLFDFGLDQISEVKRDKAGLFSGKSIVRFSVMNQRNLVLRPSFRMEETDANRWIEAIEIALRKGK